jgi:glycosyltransferase involved in cell wall biosynthesis
MAKPATISIVLPCLNEASHIAASVEAIARALGECEVEHEFVLVDDGSTDGTWQVFESLAAASPRIRALRLSRRFGKEHALCAGLEVALGDAVLVMDADLQHPPGLLPQMIRAWREEGFEVVEAVKEDRGEETWLARAEAGFFYGVLRRLSGFDLAGASDFKLLDRRVVEAWRSMPERNLFFRGMSAWLGFRRREIPFRVAPRAGGRSRWTTRGLVRLALTGITSFSSVPIHLVTAMGVVFLFFAIVLGVQTLYNKLEHQAASGFTTVILLVLIVGSFLMIGLGIIGLYVSRIYDEVKARPRYVVSDRLPKDRP